MDDPVTALHNAVQQAISTCAAMPTNGIWTDPNPGVPRPYFGQGVLDLARGGRRGLLRYAFHIPGATENAPIPGRIYCRLSALSDDEVLCRAVQIAWRVLFDTRPLRLANGQVLAPQRIDFFNGLSSPWGKSGLRDEYVFWPSAATPYNFKPIHDAIIRYLREDSGLFPPLSGPWYPDLPLRLTLPACRFHVVHAPLMRPAAIGIQFSVFAGEPMEARVLGFSLHDYFDKFQHYPSQPVEQQYHFQLSSGRPMAISPEGYFDSEGQEEITDQGELVYHVWFTARFFSAETIGQAATLT